MRNSNFILAVIAGSAVGLGVALALDPKRKEQILSAIKNSKELQALKDLALSKFSGLKDIMGEKPSDNIQQEPT